MKQRLGLSFGATVYRFWLFVWFPRRFPRQDLTDAALVFAASAREARGEGLRAAARYSVGAFSAAVRDGLAERTASLKSPTGLLEGGWQDVRLGLRRLLRSPLYAAVVILSLGIGIGLNSMLFSAVNAVFLKPLDVPRPDELVRVFTPVGRETLASTVSLDVVEALNERVPSLAGVAGVARFTAAAELAATSQVITGELVTTNYLDVLEVSPSLGRGLEPTHGLIGGPRVALISHAYWSAVSENGSSLVGEVLQLNREPFTVIGVMPAGFGGLNFANHVDVWLASSGEQAVGVQVAGTPTTPSLSVIARLLEGASLADAERQINAVVDELTVGMGPGRPNGAYFVLPERAGLMNPAMPQLVPLAAVVMVVGSLLVLLVACSNVAGLALARSFGLLKELGVRLALGARGTRLFRQLLIEGAVLILPAALLGLALAGLADEIFSYLLPFLAETDVTFRLDRRTLFYGTAVTILALLMAGAVPAVFATRASQLGRVARTARGSGAQGLTRLLRGLVFVEVAFAAVVLVIASLFVQTLWWYNDIDPGFETTNRMAVTLDVGFHGLDEGEGRAFFDELFARVSNAPAMDHAALAAGITRSGASLDVRAADLDQSRIAQSNIVGVGYFETLGIPLIRGRDFGGEDPTGPAVAIVSETLAAQLWPGQPALSRSIQIGTPGAPHRVVGVVRDIRSGPVLEEPEPVVYLPFGQHYRSRMSLIVASTLEPTRVVEDLRSQVQRLQSGLPIVSAVTLEDAVNANRILARAAASIGITLGLAALFLAAVGLFGMLTFVVRTQRGELGVRQALGATPNQIFRRVLRKGLTLGVAGAAVGLPVGLLAAMFIRDLAIGSQPFEPLMLIGIAGVVFVFVLASVIAPARHAAIVRPVEALAER